MAKLTLSLGSNLGDRTRHLAGAREKLAARLGPLIYLSPIIETPAWGNTAQPAFLNQVTVLKLTSPTPDELRGDNVRITLHRILDTTQSIEQALGRKRELHWGPRTIDIDLIFLDDLRYEDVRISLPHPWWQQRDFVTTILPPNFILL